MCRYSLFPPFLLCTKNFTCSKAFSLLSVCKPQELQPCNETSTINVTNKDDPADNQICCTFEDPKKTTVCAHYTGITIGSTATCTTASHFCLDSSPNRTCTLGLTWDGETPNYSIGIYNTCKQLYYNNYCDFSFY